MYKLKICPICGKQIPQTYIPDYERENCANKGLIKFIQKNLERYAPDNIDIKSITFCLKDKTKNCVHWRVNPSILGNIFK